MSYVLMLFYMFFLFEISFKGKLASDKSVQVPTRALLAWLVGKHIRNTQSWTPSMGRDRQLQRKHK